MNRLKRVHTEGQRKSLALTADDIMAEVFSKPEYATVIYRSLAKCAPYAKFKGRRKTLGARLLKHMTPMLLERLNADIDWETLGMQVIYRYLYRRRLNPHYGTQKAVPFRRRTK